MKNIDINELQSHVDKSRRSEGNIMKLIRWAAWTAQIVLHLRVGIRYFPLKYLFLTALLLILDDTLRPVNLMIVKLKFFDFSEAFRFHLYISIAFGILQLLFGYIREWRGKIQSTIYSGKPILQYLIDYLPFQIGESTTKRFIEPIVIFLLSFLVPEYLGTYQAFVQFVSFSTFLVAHKNYSYVKNLVWDIRDTEIQSKILMNNSDEQANREVYIAEEGKTFSADEFDFQKEDKLPNSGDEMFKVE